MAEDGGGPCTAMWESGRLDKDKGAGITKPNTSSVNIWEAWRCSSTGRALA